jgi:hypothetical protein
MPRATRAKLGRLAQRGCPVNLTDRLFALAADVRYVAIYRDGRLQTRSRSGLVGASAAESDRYEELLVNPTLLTLARQRGEIDCGGLRYLLVRYGQFFQCVLPWPGGHVSVCLEAQAPVVELAERIVALVDAVRAGEAC